MFCCRALDTVQVPCPSSCGNVHISPNLSAAMPSVHCLSLAWVFCRLQRGSSVLWITLQEAAAFVIMDNSRPGSCLHSRSFSITDLPHTTHSVLALKSADILRRLYFSEALECLHRFMPSRLPGRTTRPTCQCPTNSTRHSSTNSCILRGKTTLLCWSFLAACVPWVGRAGVTNGEDMCPTMHCVTSL